MPKMSTFTLEDDEAIREARMRPKPTPWVAIGKQINRSGEACRARWHKDLKNKPSYKLCLELIAKGVSQGAVAKQLGMPQTRVEWYLRRSRGYGVKPQARTEYRERNCLQCRDPFASEGNHNRICSSCKSREVWKSGTDFAAPFAMVRR